MPASAPGPYAGYVLPDRQRALLARITDLEVQQAQLFAARMLAVYDQCRLWEQAPGPDMFGILELAGTARIGQARASTLQHDAVRLVEVLPGVLGALQAGVAYQPAVELLLRHTRNCTDEVAEEVARRVLPQLTWNTADLRRVLLETILQVEVDLDPDGLAERERLARERRGVWIRPTEDGMCQVGADLDDLTGRRWSLEFEELVRAQKAADQAAGVKRSASQRRADVFAHLPGQLRALLHAIRTGDLAVLQGLAEQDAQSAEDLEEFADHVSDLIQSDTDTDTDAEPITDVTPPSRDETDADLVRGLMALTVRDPRTLLVHVPMSTLLDLDQRCGWIDGVGPISPHRVRLMLATAGLRRVVTDPASGIPQQLDRKTEPPPELFDANDPDATARAAEQVRNRLLAMLQPTLIEEHAGNAHDPTAAVGELVDVRDQRCTGIGCNQPAHVCDRDHEDPYPDGPTAAWNLSDKSRRCHEAKHHGWTVQRDEDTGISTWRSPLGHTYQRPGVWKAQPAIGKDEVLPPPALPSQPEDEDRDPGWDQPLTLPEPTPKPEPANTTPPTAPSQGWNEGWSDDEPPF